MQLARKASFGSCLLIGLLAASGCAQRRPTVASAFPKSAVAAPWILAGEVWDGPFEAAAPALGDDASVWGVFDPAHAWLAVYQHERDPERTLTVRAMAFDSPDAARRAYLHFRPGGAEEFRAGDEGCWTEFGVLFLWGRLVFDIFSDEPTWHTEVQAAMLAGYIQNKMPAGVPDAPL